MENVLETTKRMHVVMCLRIVLGMDMNMPTTIMILTTLSSKTLFHHYLQHKIIENNSNDSTFQDMMSMI